MNFRERWVHSDSLKYLIIDFVSLLCFGFRVYSSFCLFALLSFVKFATFVVVFGKFAIRGTI